MRFFELIEDATRDFFDLGITFTRYTFRSTRIKTFAMVDGAKLIARDLRREEYIVQFAELLADTALIGQGRQH